jgi:hypothetical protein
MLVNYLGEAEAHFSEQAKDPLFRPALHTGLLQPRRPLQPDSLLVPRMRCYGAMQTSVMGGRLGPAAAAPEQQPSCQQPATCTMRHPP